MGFLSGALTLTTWEASKSDLMRAVELYQSGESKPYVPVLMSYHYPATAEVVHTEPGEADITYVVLRGVPGPAGQEAPFGQVTTASSDPLGNRLLVAILTRGSELDTFRSFHAIGDHAASELEGEELYEQAVIDLKEIIANEQLAHPES